MIGVIGANGFIGKHLLRKIAGGPEAVRAISRHFDLELLQQLGKDVEFIQASFADTFAMTSALQDVRVIVQLVSTSSPGLENKFAVADIYDNVIPHVQFLELCKPAGVERYVFLSSGGTVYGTPRSLPISEAHETSPISSHGLTKLIVEKYMQLILGPSRVEYVSLRVSNPFGPEQKLNKGQGLIPGVLARHFSGQGVRIIGGGAAVRDFLYVDDLVDAIQAAIETPNKLNCSINIGSGVGQKIIDVVDAMETILGVEFTREHVPARQSDVPSNILDVTLASNKLGWTPKTPFLDGLRTTLHDFSSKSRERR